LFPHRLGDDDATGFVNSESDVHNGIIDWIDPLVNAISGLARDSWAGGV
jgi:hypothetical protein